MFGPWAATWASQPRLATACLARVNSWRLALAVLQAMFELKVEVSAFHGNAVLKACPWQEGSALLLGLAAAAVQLDHISFSVRGGTDCPWPRAIARLQAMAKLSIRCDAQALSSATGTGPWQLSLRLFRLNLAVEDQVALGSCVQACGTAAWPWALYLGQAARSSVTFTSLVTACGAALRWDAALQLCGARLRRLDLSHVTANCAQGVAGAAGQWRYTLALLRPDRISFSTGVSACGAVLAWPQALHLAFRATPRANALAASACERARRWQLSLALLGQSRLPKAESPEALARAAWALAKDPETARPTSGGFAGALGRAHELARQAARKLEAFKATELASLLWSLVSITCVDRPLVVQAFHRLSESDTLQRLSLKETLPKRLSPSDVSASAMPCTEDEADPGTPVVFGKAGKELESRGLISESTERAWVLPATCSMLLLAVLAFAGGMATSWVLLKPKPAFLQTSGAAGSAGSAANATSPAPASYGFVYTEEGTQILETLRQKAKATGDARDALSHAQGLLRSNRHFLDACHPLLHRFGRSLYFDAGKESEVNLAAPKYHRCPFWLLC
ncbi:unnamed protein product [Effrenium voratum]|nr:unnamed protein product [Effrenium voratum]